MHFVDMISTANRILSLVFLCCYSYQFLYLAVPYLLPLRESGILRLNRYAVLISARNEESVLPELLRSIAAQDYPREFYQVFVIADNCTDHTAEVACTLGATVYERQNKQLVGKGYALHDLLERIRRDFGDSFDGYFVFGADNLLSPDYFSQMNRTFSAGHSIITSYRNSKNFGDNWISAGYALWFLREAKYLNHARMALGTSCNVSGTGFLFSRDILAECGGWNFFLLTEDIEFSIFNIIRGHKIAYCPEAILYDEQPTSFRQSWKQRMRWSKGYIQVFQKYAIALLRELFQKRSFSCFDMIMNIMPAFILSALCILLNLCLTGIGILSAQNVGQALLSVLELLRSCYLCLFLLGVITTVSEWKKIHTSTFKKILYTFTFPIFMFTYIPISLAALFRKVEWAPITHKVAISLKQVR